MSITAATITKGFSPVMKMATRIANILKAAFQTESKGSIQLTNINAQMILVG
jgi:hypothetical protein